MIFFKVLFAFLAISATLAAPIPDETQSSTLEKRGKWAFPPPPIGPILNAFPAPPVHVPAPPPPPPPAPAATRR
ncbi:hypothetical protein M408DRAFT_26377 [Serendipita vermifera MAFF 305830]|uniref:Uncharacterized protein n=1 Tax=Serendipita vermifera MAFF 305830 TaxID=933852 RepID=A0A0C3B0Y3_SERVB|nr:hypothetical protein M408DRAFT_26377 [Serendipita vermifera MAFF 305830]